MRWKNSIEKQLMFLFLISIIVVLSVVSSALLYLYKETQERAEVRYAETFINIAFLSLDAQARRMSLMNEDYAKWDDAYEYLELQNPNFPEDNLGQSYLDLTEADVVALHNKHGELQYQHNTFTQSDSVKFWSNVNSVASFTSKGPARGFFVQNGKTYFFTSFPVTDSLQELPSNGRMTVIKEIGEDFTKDVSSAINEKFDIIPRFSPDSIERYDYGEKRSYQLLDITRSRESLTATYAFNYDGPKALPIELQITMKRIGVGVKSYLRQLFPVVVAMLALAFVARWILRHYVTKPINALINWLQQVEEQDLSEDLEPFSLSDYSEVGLLSQQFENVYSKLYEKHQFSQLLLYSINDYIFTVTNEGRVDYCNPAAAEWLKLKADVICGQEFELLLTCLDKDTPSVSNWLYRAVHTYSEYSGDANIRVLSSPDVVFPMEVQVSPMLQADESKPSGAMVILRPKSERK